MNPIPEKHTSDNALPSLESDNQAKTPVKDTKQPEMTVNPLMTGLSVDQEPEISKRLLRGITGAELAKRLGVDGGTISRQSKKGNFAEWSRLPQAEKTKGEKLPDPDNLSWERRGVRYFPIIDKD